MPKSVPRPIKFDKVRPGDIIYAKDSDRMFARIGVAGCISATDDAIFTPDNELLGLRRHELTLLIRPKVAATPTPEPERTVDDDMSMASMLRLVMDPQAMIRLAETLQAAATRDPSHG